MEQLTPKQQEVYDFIEEYQFLHGTSPTLAEIKADLKVSSDNSVLKHLKELESKKYIERSNTPRGIGLLESVKEKLFADVSVLPLLGAVPAGDPVESFESADDWIPVSSSMVKNKDKSFMLYVTGNSMKNVGILDGDMVIVDSEKRAKVGDYVVALVDNESTVKTLVEASGSYYLHPENEEYNDIYPEGQLLIQGVVVGVIRQYY